jgi:hypothetical protein
VVTTSRTIMVMPRRRGICPKHYFAHGRGNFIQAFAFSPRGNLLAAVTFQGTVLVYSLADPARPARTATVRGLLTHALYPSGSPQPEETPLCATYQPASYAVAFTPDGHALTVVVDREEMSANSGRDTIFDWHVTSAGTLGAGTAAARDVADFQPVIAPTTAPCWAARPAATPGTPGRCLDPPSRTPASRYPGEDTQGPARIGPVTGQEPPSSRSKGRRRTGRQNRTICMTPPASRRPRRYSFRCAVPS